MTSYGAMDLYLMRVGAASELRFHETVLHGILKQLGLHSTHKLFSSFSLHAGRRVSVEIIAAQSVIGMYHIGDATSHITLT
jgi:hypothetical protein